MILPMDASASTNTNDLGRWTTQVITGRGSQKVRFVTAYQPCYSLQKISSVWSQQVTVVGCNDYNPRQAFLDNLRALIQGAQSNGKAVVVGLDMNNNTAGPTSTEYWDELDM